MRILIIGKDYFHYLSSLVKACKTLGHDVLKINLIEFKKERGNYLSKNLVKMGLKSAEIRYYQNMNLQYIEITKTFKPDVCIVINGQNINQKFLLYLKENKITTRLFMIDSIQANIFRPFLKNIAYYDKIFSYEPSDLGFLADKHPEVNYLFVGYDSSVFYPLQEMKKEYDICFIGELYPFRLELLERVASYAYRHNRRMIVHTKSRYPKRDIWHAPRSFIRGIKFKANYPNVDKYIVDTSLYNEKLSEFYQKSIVCINMHAGKDNKLHSGPNPRTFEILGSRSFQLIDAEHLDYVHLKDKQHLVEYQDAEQLCENIEYYLNHEEERKKIAIAGYECAKEKYTMEECAKKLLEL